MTNIHFGSAFYDVEGFKKGKCTLLDVEVEEVGDVAGKSLLHLQCHFGQDTLCWSRLGAEVTGVDYSEKAIAQANLLAKELGISATFICSDVYELDSHLDGKFDVIFTSAGVISWLPDLRGWAETILSFLKPRGVFYIREFHPAAYMFDDSEESRIPAVRYPYFKLDEPMRFKNDGSYADPDADVIRTTYEWSHGIGEIVNALIDAGFKMDFLHELNYSSYKSHPFLIQGQDGMWRYPGLAGGLPLMFSIRAIKG